MSKKLEYDVFIAYAKPDFKFAEKIYTLLSVIGNRVFLDQKNLKGGDEWLKEIANAQEHSLLTVVLISNFSDSAYFQKAEILKAIELVREKRHRIVPVYLTKEIAQCGSVPSQLKQIQCIFFDEKDSLLDIAQKIQSAIDISKRREDWNNDIDAATIVIVTGCHHLPELYDRPIAYELKEEIDNLANKLNKSFLSSVVMGDIWIMSFSGITDHPNLISLGSPGVNGLTGKIADQGKTIRTDPNNQWHIKRSSNRWALYGNRAQDTKAAILSFKENDLKTYLHEVWDASLFQVGTTKTPLVG